MLLFLVQRDLSKDFTRSFSLVMQFSHESKHTKLITSYPH